MALLYSPHSFRVATITDFWSKKIRAKNVQHLAGHADLRTTGLSDRRKRKISRNMPNVAENTTIFSAFFQERSFKSFRQ
jgi:hypothetical protein